MKSNIEVIEELYRAFRAKDYTAFRSVCTPDIEWVQNEGFPGGRTYLGADAIIEGVFQANGRRWENFSFQIREQLDAGASIIVLGEYTGTHAMTRKTLSAKAAHVYDLRDGLVWRFRMYADTKTIWDGLPSDAPLPQ